MKVISKGHDMMIDILRALAIIFMIVLHVNARYLGDRQIYLIWAFSQWVVPAFLFCSLALYKLQIKTPSQYLVYIYTRLSRLLVPYWVFFGILIILKFFLYAKWPTFGTLLSGVFLFGGTDYNWLVLLFVYLTLLAPFVAVSTKGATTPRHWAIVTASILASIIFMFDSGFWHKHYRLIMWLPWTGLTVLLLIIRNWFIEKKYIRWLFVNSFFFFSFLIFYFYIFTSGGKIDMYSHKYPPDLYFVFFAIWSTSLAILFSGLLSKLITQDGMLAKLIHFVSRNSYEIFFVHILVMEVMNATKYRFSYQQYLLALSTIAFVLTYLLLRVKSAISNKL